MSEPIESYKCCFCLYILTKPITLKCKHSYCKECLEGYLSCLKLDKQHLEKKVASRIEIKCPTCRGVHKLKINDLDSHINHKLVEEICSNSDYKKIYLEREKEVTKEKKIEEKRSVNIKRIAVGNSYKEVPDRNARQSRTGGSGTRNKHKWVLFVRIEGEDRPEKYIEKVFVELHPTFSKNKIFLRNSPYEVSRLGWGTFDIPVKIYFKKKYGLKPVTFEHELVFTGAGAYNHHDVDFSKKKKKKKNTPTTEK